MNNYKNLNFYEKKYHYNKEFPIEIFIKNIKKVKKEKLKKNKQLCNIVKNKTKKYRLYENIVNSYYTNYEYLYEDNKNGSNNNNVCNLSKNIKNIIYYNSERIYNYYDIFNSFILNCNIVNDMFDKNIYVIFKNYIRNNEEIKTQLFRNKITIFMFYKEACICYKLIKYIIKDNSEINKKNIIKLFSMLELDVKIIYKLNKHDNGRYFEKMLVFLKDKYRRLFMNNKIDYSQNIIKKNVNQFNSTKYNEKEIKKWIKNIPIYYLGSKKKMLDIILGKIEEIDNSKNIDRFLELFGGSICLSYVLKKLKPNLDIIVYENNKLLINFYKCLMLDSNKLIENIIRILKTLEETKNRYGHINNIINYVNQELKNKIKIPSTILACYFYILNQISYKGIIKYNKNGEACP